MSRRMRRITHAFEDYHVTTPKNIRHDRRGDYTGPAIERLAEYEATELTPAEVVAQGSSLLLIQEEKRILLRRVTELEKELADVKSEREYFRSRAEFFSEVAGGDWT